MDEDEPSWKKLKLSLERPYKDDNGEPLPVLLDITADGQHIYEPREDPASKIGENLRRIFLEKGHDFFEKYPEGIEQQPEEIEDEKDDESDDNVQPMTPEELFKMRMEILPQLHIAMGEMSQARDLLSVLLSSPNQPQIPGITPAASANPTQASTLKATTVNKPAPIESVQAFNTQLVVGGKDLALRKAASLLKDAAESVEKGRSRSERYWVDALKIRRGNWGLIPAPLPLGSATGRGADRTAKDFLVAFSLEESPILFRRRAIGRVPTFGTDSGILEYPLRQYTCLQVSITTIGNDGVRSTHHNTMKSYNDKDLEESLRGAQAEVVQQEIFAALIKEASSLPTASARVSERLIIVDAAQATELVFELTEEHGPTVTSEPSISGSLCDLVFSALHVLLLRAHAHVQQQRLGRTGVARPTSQGVPPTPPILQPIVDMLQYRVFCERVHTEIKKVVGALKDAGVPVKLRVNMVGENGEQLVTMLTTPDPYQRVGGETVLRIANRHTLRFTYGSPSSLIAHLPQATLAVASITQLTQLLHDEVGSCLLGQICDIGNELCESVSGTWFVDLLTGRTVGRWEGKVLNFLVAFADDFSLVCTATKLARGDKRTNAQIDAYTAADIPETPLLQWARQTIEGAFQET